MPPWRPLLTGDAAAEAKREVDRIAAALARPAPIDEALGASLNMGQAGPALFFAYAHLSEPDRGYLPLAWEWLERAVDTLSAAPATLSLYSGAAGVAWVAQHLGRLSGEDPRGEAAAFLDRELLASMEQGPWTGSLDLMDGLAGLGVFLLDRTEVSAPAFQALGEVVDRLAERAEATPEGMSWRTPPEDLDEAERRDHPLGVYRPGVAHGAAAILYLLAGAAADGARAGRASHLLSEGVAWLLFREQPSSCRSAFPYSWPVSGERVEESRLAWCHGDAGIAATLAAVADRVGDPVWRRRALQLALRAAERPAGSSGVEDPGLCHGAAGLGHLFNRMYQRLGDERLGDRARFWLDQALRLRQRFPETGGYASLSYAPRGFLPGDAGVGLALLAAVTDAPPRWDLLLCAR